MTDTQESGSGIGLRPIRKRPKGSWGRVQGLEQSRLLNLDKEEVLRRTGGGERSGGEDWRTPEIADGDTDGDALPRSAQANMNPSVAMRRVRELEAVLEEIRSTKSFWSSI